MDAATRKRNQAALQAINAALTERIAQKRGPEVLAKLVGRLRHMNRPAGHEAAVRRLGADTALLLRVKAAIGRATGASYGECLLCHGPISPRHLNAVPWAAFCIPCRKTIDSREALLTWHKRAQQSAGFKHNGGLR